MSTFGPYWRKIKLSFSLSTTVVTAKSPDPLQYHIFTSPRRILDHYHINRCAVATIQAGKPCGPPDPNHQIPVNNEGNEKHLQVEEDCLMQDQTNNNAVVHSAPAVCTSEPTVVTRLQQRKEPQHRNQKDQRQRKPRKNPYLRGPNLFHRRKRTRKRPRCQLKAQAKAQARHPAAQSQRATKSYMQPKTQANIEPPKNRRIQALMER